jgi:tetratricopeptide (TPR) repeat protein
VLTVVALIVTQFAGTLTSSTCREVELAALIRASEQVALGDEAGARVTLDGGGERCALRAIAALALRGWSEARALASRGGALDLQGPVRRTLQELATLGTDSAWSVEVEYATTAIGAAIAAAQDERPEMELLLTHARDLSERLALRERRALWPHSYNLVAGELWFEVDRYADAVAAYERAVRADASPVALAGVARALARLGRIDEACAAYRKVTTAAAALRALAATDLARCQ